MSMISAQIDELRNYADRADGTFPMLASALRDAADTIWQLRDDLQRTNAENDKLRELVRAAYNCTNAGPSCLECRVVAGGCTLLSAMRELGIEVDA